MSTLAKVPCTIVTGFLGAGKTTLVRHVLENAGGRRLAVIVNEFGDVGIDGDVLTGANVRRCPVLYPQTTRRSPRLTRLDASWYRKETCLV